MNKIAPPFKIGNAVIGERDYGWYISRLKQADKAGVFKVMKREIEAFLSAKRCQPFMIGADVNDTIAGVLDKYFHVFADSTI